MADDTLRSDLADATDPTKGIALIGVSPVASDAKSQTLQHWIFGRSKSPMDYGAEGDGAADDTAALQKALNVGGHIYIPAKTFRITDTLIIKSDTFIESNNGRIVLDSSETIDVIHGEGLDRVSIVGIEIDGGRADKDPLPSHGRGIQLSGTNLTVRNCYIHDCSEHAIHFGVGPDPDESASFCVVEGNVCTNNGNTRYARGVGIWFFWGSSDFIISNNILRENVGGGITADDVHTPTDTDKRNNRFSISGNVIFSTQDGTEVPEGVGSSNGIWIGGSFEFTISDNVCVGYRNGIAIEDSQANAAVGNATVSGNVCRSHRSGLVLYNTALPITLTGNHFEVLEGTPAYAAVAVDNRRQKAGEEPVKLATDVSFNDNTVRSPAIGYQIADRHLEGPVNRIRINGGRVTYTGASAPPSGALGVHVRSATGAEVFGLSVDGFYNNIFFEPSTPAAVIRNCVSENAANYGIAVSDSKVIIGNMCRNNGVADLRINTTANQADTFLKDNSLLSPNALLGTVNNTIRQNNYPAF